ncbi:MAG: hypothetical protein STHCBS139747_007717 [Sporothrix thermara]
MNTPDLTPVGYNSHASMGSITEQASGSRSAATNIPDSLVDFESAPVCMYRGDCQTGSQLRKAISHIFGRNKLCTRMIPAGVWVHYCRKHYQRTRYRNGGEYPQRQIGLVQVQVRRVQAWSDYNAGQNCGPVLKDWSLSVRKREQLRLDSKMATSGKKRPFHDDGAEDEEENFDDDRAEMSGTAVPSWVVDQIGDGFSTPEILAIVDRLKSDIDQGRLQQIPDIEILPNIITDGSKDVASSGILAKKTYTKRRTAAASDVSAANGHRRSQSVNASALRYDSAPMSRQNSQSNKYTPSTTRLLSNDYQQLPMEKRQRIDDEGFGMGHRHVYRHQSHHSMSGIPDRYESPGAPRPDFGGRAHLVHRPAFAGIRENQAEGPTGSFWAEEYGNGGSLHGAVTGTHDVFSRQNSGYGIDRRYSGVSRSELQIPARGLDASRRDPERQHITSSAGLNEPAYGLLPAPNPLRLGGPSVAQQLESSSQVLNSAASRRTGVHQRSVSEAGFLHNVPLASSHRGYPSSSGNYAAPQLNSLSRASNHFSEMEPRPAAYSSYHQHQTHSSLDASLSAHHAHPNQPIHSTQHGLGHGHSHSMSHAQHHGCSSCQYNGTYNASDRFSETERRDSSSSQFQQPAPFVPSVPSSNSSSSPEKFDSFSNVQLPPLQCAAHTTPSPPQLTTAAAAPPPLSSNASSAQLTDGEDATASGPPRHLSTTSVAYMLGPSVEPGMMPHNI